MVSYITIRVGPRAEKDLPSTPVRPSPAPPPQQEDKKPLTPTHARLEDLGRKSWEITINLERRQAALTSQHDNLSDAVTNLENLLPPNPVTNDPFARMELERKLEQAKREKSGVEKERMEVGILISRIRRKLDDVEGRGDRDSFIWSRKWTAVDD